VIGIPRVEPLIDAISRDPAVAEVHVRGHRQWTWTRHDPDPEDAGVRYGYGTELTIVEEGRGDEVAVATLILSGDEITGWTLNGDAPYRLVKLVDEALR
jgi:hypothetical protein